MKNRMKQLKAFTLGIAVLASLLAPLQEANAWVAAGRGYGGRGFVAAGGGYHGGYYGGYHGGGCYGCGAAAGAVAGLAVGAMAGAAIADASRPATVYVQQPAVVVEQPVYQSAGNLPIGTQFAVLPSGSRSMVVNGVNFYQNGPNWYKPYFGSNGVYYEVVTAP
ncbi:hypothetical protein [Propionivibrio sp.]|uniref:hypothetical protein n=1 Tax=Propionivibrio sp. TaxID=2212460 RepID=UPI003BF1C6ED